MINHFILDGLPVGNYGYGDPAIGQGGLRISGYKVSSAVNITKEVTGVHWTDRYMWIDEELPLLKRQTEDFYLYVDTVINSLYDKNVSLRTFGWNFSFLGNNLHFYKVHDYLIGSDGVSTLRYHVSVADRTITCTVNGGEFSETLVMPGVWFTGVVNRFTVGIIRPSNYRYGFGEAFDDVRIRNVLLEENQVTGWYPVNSGKSPFTDNFDSYDPLANVAISDGSIDSVAVLKGTLEIPAKQLDIRITVKADLDEKPLQVTFNGTTKTIAPSGTFKYGELIFQVEDVPAGDFEIIITKEL